MDKAKFEEVILCPYCGHELPEVWSACCGEAGHGETVLVDPDTGEYLETHDS